MIYLVWLAVGLVGGGALLLFAGRYGRAREKVLAQALVIAALIYCGFAVVAGRADWLGVELLGVGVYGMFAFLGMRRARFWTGVGWLLHPVWDAGLHSWGGGAAIAPEWYVVACISFDLLVGCAMLRRA